MDRTTAYRSPLAHTVQQLQSTLREHYRAQMQARVVCALAHVDEVRRYEAHAGEEWVVWVRAMDKRV